MSAGLRAGVWKTFLRPQPPLRQPGASHLSQEPSPPIPTCPDLRLGLPTWLSPCLCPLLGAWSSWNSGRSRIPVARSPAHSGCCPFTLMSILISENVSPGPLGAGGAPGKLTQQLLAEPSRVRASRGMTVTPSLLAPAVLPALPLGDIAPPRPMLDKLPGNCPISTFKRNHSRRRVPILLGKLAAPCPETPQLFLTTASCGQGIAGPDSGRRSRWPRTPTPARHADLVPPPLW